VAVRQVDNANRYGRVQVDPGDRVTAFLEKSGGDSPGLVNGGVYIFNRAVFEQIPDGSASLEKDVFPRILGQNIHALEQDGMFIDIGTPVDYVRAQQLFDRLGQAASSAPRP